MLNNDDDIGNIITKKIYLDDDIFKYDYSFKEEEECDEAINGDKDCENSEENLIIIII